MRLMTCVLGAVAVGGICLWLFAEGDVHADEVVQPMPEGDVAHPDADMASTMHSKLVHSQDVLQGLVTQDFEQLERGAENLRATSLMSPGLSHNDALDNELYEHFRLEFLRLSTKLGELARDENLEGAAFTYNNLTANCLACHQYLLEQTPPIVTQGTDQAEQR